MRVAAIAFAAICAAAALGVPSHAATIRPPGLEIGTGAVVEAAARCGPHERYVSGHHSRRDGHWIKGHCVRKTRIEPVDHSCHMPGGTSTGSGCERGDHHHVRPR
jgi:hypothetical protein